MNTQNYSNKLAALNNRAITIAKKWLEATRNPEHRNETNMKHLRHVAIRAQKINNYLNQYERPHIHILK